MRAAIPPQRGVTLIEVMLGLAILGILLTLAIPSFTQFLQNQKIKNAAETTLQGLNLARTEAVRRNASMRFQFVSALTSGCALSATAMNWVVSQADPSGACDTAPSPTGNIVQVKSANDGTQGVTMAATPSTGTTIVFTGLGRVSSAGFTQLDFSFPGGGTCQKDGGTMRCMRIIMSTSGSSKVCDPQLTVNTPQVDPRECQ